MDSMGSILYITLGCAKNEVDTDRMRSLLSAAGYTEALSTQDAELVLINTCSFLASATTESIETTLQLADEVHGSVRSIPIVMCGCVPSRYRDDLPSELPEVAAFVKTTEEDEIVAVVDRVLHHTRSLPAHVPSVKRTVEGSVAYVKISDGCDRMCSFCAIPFIRGRYHSRSSASILSEIDELVSGGVREIVLIGQDTGVWGSDFTEDTQGPHDLAQLLSEAAQHVRGKQCWLRVLYLQPEGMTDALISVLRDVPEVLPYIDIPVQHCCSSVLTAMNRTGDEEQLEALFARLRQEIPDMVIRTTYLAGFPGESDDDHERMLRFMDRVGFDYTSVFPYSAEDGTRAARMQDQISQEDKLRRAQEAQDLAESLGFASTAARVGQSAEVIVDGVEQTEEGYELIGHAWFQAPDCDGVVHIDASEAQVGDILTVEFTDSFCYELVGRVVE